MNDTRAQLDRLFAFDAGASVVFGILALVAPHGILTSLSGGSYSHGVHETLRLYGCLRLACGWILWHVRRVDDGSFRRSVCEALCFCYLVQSLAILRGQLTDNDTSRKLYWYWNWLALVVLLTVAAAYSSFRFRGGGNLIKIYELPTSGNLQ